MGSECRRKEQSGGRRMREWLIYYAEERQLHYIEGHNNIDVGKYHINYPNWDADIVLTARPQDKIN